MLGTLFFPFVNYNIFLDFFHAVALVQEQNELNKAAAEAKRNKPKQERTCYFERAKLKREAFKDKPKAEHSREKDRKKTAEKGL